MLTKYIYHRYICDIRGKVTDIFTKYVHLDRYACDIKEKVVGICTKFILTSEICVRFERRFLIFARSVY